MKTFFLLSILLLSITSASARFCNGVLCDNSCANCYPCQQEINCYSPQCRCASKDIPLGIPLEDAPQFVFLTFDDALRIDDYVRPEGIDSLKYVRENPLIKDANNCPIKVSAYLTFQESDPAIAQYFKETGALFYHSYAHVTSLSTSLDGWRDQLNKAKEDFAKLAQVDTIIGSRAPYLETNDHYFTVLQEVGVQFDSSMAYGFNHVSEEQQKPYYPFTLDFGVPEQTLCLYYGSCPIQPHNGLWEFPLTAFQNPSFMMDYNPYSGIDQVLADMKQDFLDSYNFNRAPRGYYIHWRYLSEIGDYMKIDALKRDLLVRFFEWVSTLPNIIFTTEDKVLNWMKDPADFETTKMRSDFQCPTQVPAFTPYNSCPVSDTTCLFDASWKALPYTVCGEKCPSKIPTIYNTWDFDQSNKDANHWPGSISINVFDSWPAGFCASIYASHTGSVPAKAYLLSLSALAEKGSVTAFWGLIPAPLPLDESSSIHRQFSSWNDIPPASGTEVGGFCMQLLETYTGLDWIARNVRTGIDFYDVELECPLQGCAVFCGDGRCDRITQGEDEANCQFDCLDFGDILV